MRNARKHSAYLQPHWMPRKRAQARMSSPSDAPKSDIQRRAAIRKDHLDNYLRLGLGSVIQLRYSHAKSNFFERCPRIRKDGSRGKQLDAANPLFIETSRHAIREEARTLEGHPAVVGAQTASEIRDSSEPSYTPAMRAA